MFNHLVFGTIVIFFFISQIIVTSFFYLLSLSLVVFIFLDFLCVGNYVLNLLILTVGLVSVFSSIFTVFLLLLLKSGSLKVTCGVLWLI